MPQPGLHSTLEALGELIGAAGLTHPGQISPSQIMMRLSPVEAKSFAEVYEFLEPGELLRGTAHPAYAHIWAMADINSFAPIEKPDGEPAPASLMEQLV